MKDMSTRITSGSMSEATSRAQLRDMFAAHALAGMMTKDIGWMGPAKLESIARTCYEMADAMLTVREES